MTMLREWKFWHYVCLYVVAYTSKMRNKYLYITLLAILGFNAETIQAQERQLKMAPRLVVNITIDQLRSDYLEAFSPLYRTDGFRRLMDKGMVFSNASFPFLPIDRASAIASIATGTTPYYNNIVGEQWLNRETLRPVYCIYDANYVGLLTNEPSAPSALKTSTISDELKVSLPSLLRAMLPFCRPDMLPTEQSGSMTIVESGAHRNITSATYQLGCSTLTVPTLQAKPSDIWHGSQ